MRSLAMLTRPLVAKPSSTASTTMAGVVPASSSSNLIANIRAGGAARGPSSSGCSSAAARGLAGSKLSAFAGRRLLLGARGLHSFRATGIAEIVRQRMPATTTIGELATTFFGVTKAQIPLARNSGGFPTPPLVGQTASRGIRAGAGVQEMAVENVPVVSVDWLHQQLGDPNLQILDASWYMPFDKRNPLQEYQESHIPGALFFDVDGIVDMTSEIPHMLPSEAAFSAAMSALGLENQNGIVVYDGKGIFSAARVWWMFRAFGHEKVWVLDGGLPQWHAQNYPVESAASEALTRIQAASKYVKDIYQGEQVDLVTFKAQLQQDLVWSLDQVKQNIEGKKYQLVDARSKARFNGSAPEPRKGVRGGHIPGSSCVPFTEVLSSKGTLLPSEELAGKFKDAGIVLDSPIVASCGTGVTACVLALALHRLGKVDVPVYDGSWTEWGLSPSTPIVTSEEANVG